MQIKYVECPRDAWQGMKRFVPTAQKVAYLNALLDAGFTHLDLGSFVSPKAVPQLQDTEAVLAELPDPQGREYLCIVANEKGMERANGQPKVTAAGFPLSLSETFQMRNTNQDMQQAWQMTAHLKALADQGGKQLVVYLSMGFGNPYGDPWSPLQILDSLDRLADLDIKSVALADTVGHATPSQLLEVCSQLQDHPLFKGLGLHLHARSELARPLVEAGLTSGIRWFEGALGGKGGCPFAQDELVGNLPTEHIMDLLQLPFVTSERLLSLSQDVFCDTTADF